MKRNGKERKGKERKEKEGKGKKRKGKEGGEASSLGKGTFPPQGMGSTEANLQRGEENKSMHACSGVGTLPKVFRYRHEAHEELQEH